MIYWLGFASELKDIQLKLDKEFESGFKNVDDVASIANPTEAELVLIGPSFQQPVKIVQEITGKDKLLSIIVFADTGRYKQIKQSIQFSPSVGTNTSCILYNPSVDYSQVFNNGIVRTRQKRKFSQFNLAAATNLSRLTSPMVRLDHLGHILEHAPIAAILINRDFKIVGANKTSRQLFSQLEGGQISMRSIFSKKDIEEIRKFRNEKSETVITLEDLRGNYYEVSCSSVPGPEVDNVLLLINDITDKKEKDRRVASILDSLPQIAWTAAPDGKINYYNQGWYNYTNKAPVEGMGEAWINIIHPDDKDLLMGRWTEAIRERKSFQQAARFKRFNGEYRWHLSKGVPLYSKTREIIMWVGTSIDVHDQVSLNEELERKVRDRTRLLEETNAELEQFAYISSHDLQEPLRKIQTFASIVKDESSGRLNENGNRYLDKIIATSSRMSKLVKDLLNFTKINQQERIELLDLNGVINHIREDLELTIFQNRAHIEVGDLPTITARPLQIRQLFYNIISNSLKYHRPDVDPVVTIFCRKLEKEAQSKFKALLEPEYWEIVVKDNGIGFEQKYADQIFTVFQRLHSRSSYEGTGIGLAIAKKVVVNHGGEIFGISSVGNGAEFHVILPAGQ